MKESLENSLIRSIESENLKSLSKDLTEATIDSVIKNETLKDIPIVGALAKTYSIGKDIRNYFYIRKVSRFLYQLKDISSEEREEFLNKLDESNNLQEFGETVLLLLERSDHLYKPILIGNIIKALIQNELHHEKAMRICMMIDRSYYRDLIYLRDNESNLDLNKTIAEQLKVQGFLSVRKDNFELGADEKKYNIYYLNELGEAFLKFAFK